MSQTGHGVPAPPQGQLSQAACFRNTRREQDTGLPGRALPSQLHSSGLHCLKASSHSEHLLPHSPAKHPCSPLLPRPPFCSARSLRCTPAPRPGPAPHGSSPGLAGEFCKTALEIAPLLCSECPLPVHPLPNPLNAPKATGPGLAPFGLRRVRRPPALPPPCSRHCRGGPSTQNTLPSCHAVVPLGGGARAGRWAQPLPTM